MRRYLYAGAVAGGFLLLGAAPAHADVLPAPAGAQQDAGALGGLLGSSGGLDPAGGLRVADPLGGAGSLLDVKPGDNSADVPDAAGTELPVDGVPAARTGLGRAGDRTAQRPARATTEDLPAVGGGLPVSNLPISNLLQGGLPLIGNLMPNGPTAGLSRADQESGLLGSDLPLLGGLLEGPAAPAAPDVSGLPAGGTDVPVAQDPARTKPAAATPAEDPATANDARLHEEPTDPEGKGGNRRAFSDGRPVAGVDPDFK
ncbi:MAG TPA: hypothetical protein VH502_12805 [Actinoplanes sp.]